MDESSVDGCGRDWLEIVPRSYAQPEISARPSEYRPAYTYGLNPLSADQLLTRKFDPPEHVLAPWLQTQGLAMIHAPRGIGKTHVSIGAACAVAAGI